MRIPLLIIALFAIPLSSLAQQTVDIPRNPVTSAIEYIDRKEVPGATRAQLVSRAQAWAKATFKSSQPMVEYADAHSGRLVAKGSTEAKVFVLGRMKTSGYYDFHITIDTEDGNYKAIIDEIVWWIPGSLHPFSMDKEIIESVEPLTKKRDIALVNGFDKSIRDVLASLNKYMNTK